MMSFFLLFFQSFDAKMSSWVMKTLFLLSLLETFTFPTTTTATQQHTNNGEILCLLVNSTLYYVACTILAILLTLCETVYKMYKKLMKSNIKLQKCQFLKINAKKQTSQEDKKIGLCWHFCLPLVQVKESSLPIALGEEWETDEAILLYFNSQLAQSPLNNWTNLFV